jgi:ABC-type transport system substrate-binding protein
LAAAATAVALSLVPTVAGAHTSRPTLTLDLPGPFTGCSYVDPRASDSLRAVLDLVRPSAFQTTYQGALTGATGPIASAELISLSPQTVVYTVSKGWSWSDGQPFTGEDLLHWYQSAVDLPTSATDGYRDIQSLTASADDLQVTAIFDQPFADWATLFRDVDETDTTTSCTLEQLADQASLGPYDLISLTRRTAVLSANPRWKGPPAGFPRVVVRTDASPNDLGGTVVDYRYDMTQGELEKVTSNGRLNGHLGSSNQIVTVGFSPRGAWGPQLAVRQFLGWSIDRQSLLNDLVGPITTSQAPADSVIFAQGAAGYAGPAGLGPVGQTGLIPATTVPASEGGDCVACAAPALEAGGFRFSGGRWISPHGKTFAIRLVVGPALFDRAAAARVVAAWRLAGVRVTVTSATSDRAAADALFRGVADAGVFTTNTGTLPFTAARSWTSTDYGDGYDMGWRSTQIDQWYAAALDDFNPNDALSDYQNIDHFIEDQSWERPLFTEPSILDWSIDIAGVYGSLSLAGLVDQITQWSYVSPAELVATGG